MLLVGSPRCFRETESRGLTTSLTITAQNPSGGCGLTCESGAGRDPPGAIALRVANCIQIRDGSVPYLHQWTQSNMSFYDRWARDVVGGDGLTDAR